jgi:hypothetical protein
VAESYLVDTANEIDWSVACNMNSDAYPDIFVNCGEYGLVWFQNYFAGTLWLSRQFPNRDVNDISSADIDDDGDIDVAAALSEAGQKQFVWFERLDPVGSQWQMHEISDQLYELSWKVYTIDMDGDGDIDVIGSCTKRVFWWENTGGGQNWLKHDISPGEVGSWLSSIDVADVDDDGDYDVLCGDNNLSSIFLFINPGSMSTWEVQEIDYETSGRFLSASFGNINGDDLLDIVAGPFSTPEIIWFENNGLGDWPHHQIASDMFNIIRVYSDDIDGDGDSDVYAAISGAPPNPYNIAWWENIDAVNGVWMFHPVDTEMGMASSITCADINQDGKKDLVSSYDPYSDIENTVLWWDLYSGYSTAEAGQLESGILYVNDVEWGSIDWTANTPAGTSVTFEVRSSDDWTEMGLWSESITTPGSLSGILTDYDSYVQYKANLHSSDPSATPVLENIILTWNPLGIEEGEVSTTVTFDFSPNPFSSSLGISYSLPEPGQVNLSVYDLSGRLVENLVSGSLSAGENTSQWDPDPILPDGCYLIVLDACGERAVRRCVKLN